MSNEQEIETDVLIIGGGIQGLWMLNDLIRHRYKAILLERRLLGSQQTCHSHVYIHHGHVYLAEQLNTGTDLIERFRNSRTVWDSWLSGRQNVVRGYGPPLFGFRAKQLLEDQIDMWSNSGLLYVPNPTMPDILTGGVVNAVCQSTEDVLDGHWLMKELSQPIAGCIGRIHKVDMIHVGRLSSSGDSRITVKVNLRDGKAKSLGGTQDIRVFSSRAVILTAGAGNGSLLKLARDLDGQPLAHLRTRPVIRQGHMLVIRGSREKLPPLTGIFPDVGGLFLVSRQTEDETIWLVSDANSPRVDHADELVASIEGCDTTAWLPNVIRSLEQLAPKFFGTDNLRRQYSWGIYDAPKAEQEMDETDRRPGHWEQVPKTGLFVILPTKLTLAPLMSQEVLQDMARVKIHPSKSTPPSDLARTAGLAPVEVAEERWRYLPMNHWPGFCSYHMLT